MSAIYDVTYSSQSPCTILDEDACPVEGCEGTLSYDRYGAVCPVCGYEYDVDMDPHED